MKDRIIENLNYEEMQEKAQNYYDKIKESYLKGSKINLTKEGFFETSFEII